MKRITKETAIFTILGIPMVICLAAFMLIVLILSRGFETLQWSLMTTSALQGGLFEMIIGTVYLFLGATAVAGPIGVLAAIYLTEYAQFGRLTRIIDQSINNLAGVPSIVIGLFGYTFFCRQLGLGISLAAGWLTLTLMMLPIVIRGTEEAIKMVPESFKEAALALGTTKWKAVSSMKVSPALPGIITSVILGVARIAGETAAILFTACVLVTRGLPKSPLEPVMALAYNLFVKIVALGEPPEKVFGIALVLFFIVILFTVTAIVLRFNYRRKQQWLR
ncbi:MAG: phosphate ABC transporter permease PstA [Candidatus Bathyarchaeales archaeon]